MQNAYMEVSQMQIADFNAPAAKNISKIIEEKGLKQIYVAEKAGYKLIIPGN